MATKKRNTGVLISPAQVALLASKTVRQNKSIDTGAFQTNDAEGINCLKALLLFTGKLKSGGTATNVLLLMGKITKEDLEGAPDYAIRWNEKDNCAEINVRRYIGKVGGPKIATKDRYPPDESFCTWIKLVPGDVYDITNWNKDGIPREMEFSIVKILNFFAISTDPSKDKTSKWWVPFTFRFGSLPPLVRPPGHDGVKDVLSILPYKMFRTPSPRELSQMNQNDCAVQFLHTIPDPAVNPQTITDATSHVTWTVAVCRREAGHAPWCYDERVKGQTGPPAAAPGAPAATIALTSALVPLTKKKRGTFVGTIQQKDDPMSTDFSSFRFTMTAWHELIEETFATFCVDNWIAIKDYVPFADAHWLTKINLERTMNAVTNASYMGEDGEDDGQQPHHNCYDDDNTAAGTAALTPAAPAKNTPTVADEDEDYATLVKNTQASAAAAAVAAQHFDGTINMTALRAVFNLAAFIKSVGFKVSAKWPKKSVVGADGKKQLRNIFTRMLDFKPRYEPTVPELLPSVVCVSDYKVEKLEDFCKLVTENKGELYVLPESCLEENQLARIASLSIADSEAVLEDSPKAPFRINKTVADMRYVLYYIHNIKNEKKLAADRINTEKLITAVKEKILVPEIDDEEEAALAAAENAAAAAAGAAAAAATEPMDASTQAAHVDAPEPPRRNKKAQRAATETEPFEELAATGSGTEGDEALKRMSAATKANKKSKKTPALADE